MKNMFINKMKNINCKNKFNSLIKIYANNS